MGRRRRRVSALADPNEPAGVENRQSTFGADRLGIRTVVSPGGARLERSFGRNASALKAGGSKPSSL
ncbi:MAG: hypothetical protein K0R61_5305 [Microvirga sp.]|nr:hypothetical protein [Microvirga sp.]